MNLTNNTVIDDTRMEYENIMECTRKKSFYFLSLFVALIVVTTTYFGNTLILVTLRKFSKQFKGSMFMLIGNLAVADICIAFGISLHLLKQLLDILDVKVSPYFCFFKMAVCGLSIICSGLSLMTMSLDRFCAIVFPLRHMLRHKTNTRRVRFMIGAIWTFSTLASFIPTFMMGSRSKFETEVCSQSTRIPREVAIAVVVFLTIQLVFNSVLFTFVLWKIRSTQKQKAKESIINGETNVRKSKRISDKAKLMAKVYIIFALCWLPFITLTLLLETNISQKRRLNFTCMREYSLMLGFLNSGLNWIVYGLANKRFRRGFHRIMCRSVRDQNRSFVVSSSAT